MKKLFSILLIFSFGLATTISANAKVLDLIEQDNPILRKVAINVTSFDEQLETLKKDMTDTLIKNNGVGIAAPQVGKNMRIFLIEYNNKITEYINPTIIIKEGEQNSVEGCLSLPGIWGIVKRPQYIKGKAFNLSGKEFEFEANGDEACFICHEYDHLDGKLFTDFAIKTFTEKQIMHTCATFIIGAITTLLIPTLYLVFHYLLV